MKVAIIAPSVFPINSKMDYGGIEVVIWNLINEFAKMDDIEYTLFAPKGSEAPGGELVETIEPPREFGMEERDSLDKITYRLHEFDIINDHTHQGWLVKMDRCAQRAWGYADTPIVKVFHGLQTWKEIPPRPTTIYVLLSQYHNQDCHSKYREFPFPPNYQGIENRTYGFKIIPHGIDLEKYAFEPDKEDYYFHPGLIAPHKGHTVTFNLAKALPHIQFKIGGEDQFIPDPSHREWVISRCDVQDNVEYLGTLKDAEKIKLLQKAKGVLLPFQIGEAFSLLAIESLSCGTPIITSHLGSMPEIVNGGSTGYLAYSDLLNRFMDAIQRIEAGGIKPEDCRKDAEARFGRKLMAERYVEVFREVLNGKRL